MCSKIKNDHISQESWNIKIILSRLLPDKLLLDDKNHHEIFNSSLIFLASSFSR